MHDPRFLRRAWLSLLWLLPLPLLVEYSGLDVRLENYYFDAATQSFPWRGVWWFNAFLHDGLRTALIFFTVAMTGLLLASMVAPGYLPSATASRWCRPRVLAYLLAGMLLGPLLIGLLKQVFMRPCPWDLQLYGGHAPYTALLTPPLFSWHDAGRCFPAAHASGGFSLLAFVPLLAGRRRVAMTVVALAAGTVLGWTRMMQGAHFLSHNLWSAWLCWAVTLVCYALMRPYATAADSVTSAGS